MAARSEHTVAASFKDAAIATVIALALFGPLVGLKTEVTTGGLFLSQRWETWRSPSPSSSSAGSSSTSSSSRRTGR